MSYHKPILYVTIGLLAVILAACGSQPVPAAVDTVVPAAATAAATLGVPPEAIAAAQQWLAQQLSVTAEQVTFVEVERVEWTDSCLGLGQPNESCLQVITPGWRLVFEVNGERVEVRTDETATVIRRTSP